MNKLSGVLPGMERFLQEQPHYLSLKEIAQCFGVSVNTISRWVEKGMPVVQKGTNGEKYSFDLQTCRQWHKENFLKNSNQESTGDVPPVSVSRARYEHSRALLAELDLQEREGTLVNVKAIQNQLFIKIRTIRDMILNIAPRVSSIVAAELGSPESAYKVSKVMEKEIHTILEEMSNISGEKQELPSKEFG